MKFTIEYNGNAWTRNLTVGEVNFIRFPDGKCYQIVILDHAAKQYDILSPLAILDALEEMSPEQLQDFPIHVERTEVITLR